MLNKGIAIGEDRLENIEFEGTIFVGTNNDDDWIGSIFSFQVKLRKIIKYLVFIN